MWLPVTSILLFTSLLGCLSGRRQTHPSNQHTPLAGGASESPKPYLDTPSTLGHELWTLPPPSTNRWTPPPNHIPRDAHPKHNLVDSVANKQDDEGPCRPPVELNCPLEAAPNRVCRSRAPTFPHSCFTPPPRPHAPLPGPNDCLGRSRGGGAFLPWTY